MNEQTTERFEQIPATTRKRRPKKDTPKERSIAERVAHLEELPWNALADERTEAHNALLRALKGEG